MTPQDQIRALAELDGFEWDDGDWTREAAHGTRIIVNPMDMPEYLYSRDALQPILERLVSSEIDSVAKQLRSKFNGRAFFNPNRALICASPVDVAEAILRATGRWK